MLCLSSNIPSVATAVGCVLSLLSVLAAIVVVPNGRRKEVLENLKVVDGRNRWRPGEVEG